MGRSPSFEICRTTAWPFLRSFATDQPLVQVPHQGFEKVHNLRLLHRTGIDAKVKVPPGEPSGYRQAFPIEVVLQDGCLPSRRPSAAALRSLAQAAFVDEHQDAALAQRFFFSAGHTFFFQCWICSSLRSRARPSGRCGLQRRLTRIFHTWSS
jgi:hypothetical protein